MNKELENHDVVDGEKVSKDHDAPFHICAGDTLELYIHFDGLGACQVRPSRLDPIRKMTREYLEANWADLVGRKLSKPVIEIHNSKIAKLKREVRDLTKQLANARADYNAAADQLEQLGYAEFQTTLGRLARAVLPKKWRKG